MNSNQQQNEEDLDKLKEMIQKVQAEAKLNKDNNGVNQPAGPRNIKIELGRRYSSNWLIHWTVSFLVNFILIFAIVKLFKLADIRNDLIFLPLAFLFTVYEESIKAYLFRKQDRLVIYSSGLIFFFSYLVFFYLVDLQVFRINFSFRDPLYPIAFIVLLQITRTMVKTTYLMWLKRLNKNQRQK
jgi:hypothetical protein